MFIRLMPALAFLLMFGCGAVQTRPATTPEEFVIRRTQGREGTYVYTAGVPDVDEQYFIVLDAGDSYYHHVPVNLPGSMTFTVTLYPDSAALAPFYEQLPEGIEMRPVNFMLGGGDSYYSLRGHIDFDMPSLRVRPHAPEESFSFEAPSGIRTGFDIRILELHDGDTGESEYEVTDATPCPSGDAFSVVMRHAEYGGHHGVAARYVGRSSFLSCRYTIDVVEDTADSSEIVEIEATDD